MNTIPAVIMFLALVLESVCCSLKDEIIFDLIVFYNPLHLNYEAGLNTQTGPLFKKS